MSMIEPFPRVAAEPGNPEVRAVMALTSGRFRPIVSIG
jgi:hypothetical protein